MDPPSAYSFAWVSHLAYRSFSDWCPVDGPTGPSLDSFRYHHDQITCGYDWTFADAAQSSNVAYCWIIADVVQQRSASGVILKPRSLAINEAALLRNGAAYELVGGQFDGSLISKIGMA